MAKLKKKSLVGWVWKDKGIDKSITRTPSGVEMINLSFYKKRPWCWQKVRITIEELKS